MKKIVVTVALFCSVSISINAQTSKFFVNKATTANSNCDCKTVTSIKVTIPIPANVTSFDSYLLYVNLSSLDVPASIGFEKKEIASKLAGKKEYTAYLLKEDGSSDFYFDDVFLSKKDLCGTPRMWRMTEMTMEAGSAGYKIIGHHYEDTWNEYYKRWDNKEIEDWDEGVVYGEAEPISIKQAPLSDGFYDENEFIFVKAANTDSASYSISSEVEAKGQLAIEDNSQDFKTTISYAYFQNQNNSFEELKNTVLNALSAKYQVGPVHNFYELQNMQLTAKKEIAGKSSTFSTVTINGVSYETASYAQNKTKESSSYNPSDIGGFYATYYLAKVGKYDVIVVSFTNNIDPTDSNIKKIDEINSKWLNATTYK